MTKTLFVCYGNVGRGQMAEAFYNHLSKSKNAFSAETDPKTPKKYSRVPDEIYTIMLEEGIDLSQQEIKTIKKQFVEDAEQIFVMCKPELCPEFLINSDKIIFWEIEDPYQMNLDGMRTVRDQIKAKVKSIL